MDINFLIPKLNNMKWKVLACVLISSMTHVSAQKKYDPKETEIYSPVPRLVTAGKQYGQAPSDAIQLLTGTKLSEWEADKAMGGPAGWIFEKGIMTVNKKAGDIRTKRKFTNFQLHLEYRIPKHITGTGQARGNSGLFLASLEVEEGAGGYEIQILDNYQNSTYVNGQAASIYKQYPPLVNACKPPGEWQTYDVVWKAPRFRNDGTLESPATITAFHNGVLVQDHAILKGDTPYTGPPVYRPHGPAPIKLQAHGDKSEPISFKNIWIREL